MIYAIPAIANRNVFIEIPSTSQFRLFFLYLCQNCVVCRFLDAPHQQRLHPFDVYPFCFWFSLSFCLWPQSNALEKNQHFFSAHISPNNTLYLFIYIKSNYAHECKTLSAEKYDWKNYDGSANSAVCLLMTMMIAILRQLLSSCWICRLFFALLLSPMLSFLKFILFFHPSLLALHLIYLFSTQYK